jgi:hypothetical protein
VTNRPCFVVEEPAELRGALGVESDGHDLLCCQQSASRTGMFTHLRRIGLWRRVRGIWLDICGVEFASRSNGLPRVIDVWILGIRGRVDGAFDSSGSINLFHPALCRNRSICVVLEHLIGDVSVRLPDRWHHRRTAYPLSL